MIEKLYICVTDGCNLACKGCYKFTGLSVVYPHFLDLNKVTEYIDILLQKDPNLALECTFHGGEPFYLGGEEQLEKYIKLIDKYARYPNIIWSATTNLIYDITSTHLKLFNKFYNKFIKTSWDVENYRFSDDRQKQLWENNVKTLLSYGFIIQPIITVNTQTITHSPEELYEYFIKLGVKSINFERITLTGRAKTNPVKPTNREVDEWLYKAYCLNKRYGLDISLFNELIHADTNGFIGCRRRECMQTVRTINTDGSIGACPNCSDIHIIGIDGKYNQVQEENLLKQEQTVSKQCLFCKYYKLCNGDCCQLEFDETGCPGLTKIYEEVLR